MKITWEKTFDAAHFLPGHPKCGRLHGHTYHVFVEIVVQGDEDLWLERHPHYLMDYAEIKEIVMELDHRLLVAEDHEKIRCGKASDRCRIVWDDNKGDHLIELPQDDIVILPITDTSAECLSQYLVERIRIELQAAEFTSFSVRVKLKETPNTSAEAFYGI